MQKARMLRYIEKLELLNERITDVSTWIRELESNIDKKTLLATYKAFQEAVECSMDLCAMVLKDLNLVPKDDYTNIDTLFAKGFISKKLSEALKEANGLRNRLVHHYNGISDKKAISSMESLLHSLSEFAEVVSSWLERMK